MKHTPGPWEAIETPDSAGFIYYDIKGPGERFVVACDGVCALKNGEDAANAYLIAAAPDMYEALAMMVSAVMGSGDATQALSYARAAIAKAEGNA